MKGGRLAAEVDEKLSIGTRKQLCFDDTPIEVITPQESLEAVRACLASEESARTGEVVRLA